MQFFPPKVKPPTRTGPWIRQRDNDALLKRVAEPLTVLYNTPDDAWFYGSYNPNNVWLAAGEEYNRRFDLYMQKKPF